MHTCVVPTGGVGQLDGDASTMLELRLKPPITASTVSSMRLLVKQPEPLATGVSAVPEHCPVGPAKAPSTGTWLGTACRAAWRVASATVEVTQSTRNRSIERASRKNRSGKTSANSTRAWPFFRRISIRPSAMR